jgi:hypothetical protein
LAAVARRWAVVRERIAAVDPRARVVASRSERDASCASSVTGSAGALANSWSAAA